MENVVDFTVGAAVRSTDAWNLFAFCCSSTHENELKELIRSFKTIIILMKLLLKLKITF